MHNISPTYYDDNIFNELHKEMKTFYVDNKPVHLMNGRTGSLNDPYATSCSPIQQNKLLITIPKRNNCKSIVNSHGEKIIRFCHMFDLKILKEGF